jgi:hypothetical protein
MNWEGIIGTTVGVIATLVTTQLLKSLGNIDLFFINWSFKAYQWVHGREIESEDFGAVDDGRFSAIIQVYNASESSKVLRNISIVFEYDGGMISKTPYDERTSKLAGGGIRSDQLTVLNLPPKQMIEVPMYGRLTKDEAKHLQLLKSIYFEARFPNGKKIKKVIT